MAISNCINACIYNYHFVFYYVLTHCSQIIYEEGSISTPLNKKKTQKQKYKHKNLDLTNKITP